MLQAKGVTDLSGLKMGTGREWTDYNAYGSYDSPDNQLQIHNDGRFLDFGGTQIGNLSGVGAEQDVIGGGQGGNEFANSMAGQDRKSVV